MKNSPNIRYKTRHRNMLITSVSKEIIIVSLLFHIILPNDLYAIQAKGPVINLQSQDFNMGSLMKGTLQKLTIEFTNIGDEPLVINYKGSTCGCLEISDYSRETYPDQEGYIEVKVDSTKSHAGRNVQEIVFQTNDPNKEYLHFTIRYKVKPAEIIIKPPIIEFDPKTAPTNPSQDIRLESIFILDLWEEKLKLSDIQISSNLKGQMKEVVEHCLHCPQQGELHYYSIDLSIRPVTKMEALSEWISFKTNHPRYPLVTIPVVAQVQSALDVVPRKIVFRSLDDTILRETQVHSKWGEKLHIGEIASKVDWLTVTQERINDTTIKLLVQPNTNVLSRQKQHQILKGEIVVKTLMPKEETCAIEVIMIF